MIGEEHHCGDDETTVVLDVTAMSHGPDAVARHDGRVVFVPHAAPGDRVRARVVTAHASYARAEIAHRCRPGASYREPPCPWVAECGGCPWQQVTYPAQLEAKARNVREALARIARVAARRELPIRAAPDEWEYRHRIRLHVGPERSLGFRRARSHAIVEIGGCAIADPALSAVLPIARALVADLAVALDTIDLVANGRGGVVVVAAAGERASERDGETITRWLADTPAVAGVLLAGRGWERAWRDTTIAVTPVAGLPPIHQRPHAFSQVNPGANRLLVETVAGLAAPAARVLDLFCGAGNLSLPLAHGGAEVVGVERSATSVADGRAAAAAAGLDVRFEVAVADRFLRQQGLAGAELVVLDPPRGGAATVAEQLGRLRPARILYVSCDPATLARDVATLTRAGYAVDRLQAIDLFPQTEHVETVLEAVRA
jgi:23S rRNA (uracil1939-C5)-methyltransferase